MIINVMAKYNFDKVERKWQKKWDELKLHEASNTSDKEKAYYLVEFPYPSGAGLHVGHVRSYTALDAMVRKKRMQGFNVLYPIGWDAFGLPTENYAIKTGIQPVEVTKKNVAVYKKQIKRLGISFDWSREINTTDPEYYKWTQWIFLKLHEKGLAYKKKMPINWCPSCKIGLANEEVVNGHCERCGGFAEKKVLEQWILKITEYADRLIDDLETVDYLDKIKTSQVNWIGRSLGTELDFTVKGSDDVVRVFTTRPDTLFGVTYLVLSPEHVLVNTITTDEHKQAVLDYQAQARNKSDMERTDLAKEKTGVFTGAYAVNPVNNEAIPIWIADYVLATYGTGAIMAVPAHDTRDFEFAQQFDLPIREVIRPVASSDKPLDLKEAFTANGVNVNSDFLNGLETEMAIQAMNNWLAEKGIGKTAKNYKLRDWIFSRQHYWGEPIPIVFCDTCGEVRVPEEQLPLLLPKVERYEPTDTGESPLATIEEWVNTTCPKCEGPARRETDTMPNWAGSSWYFLRYLDPKNNEALASKESMDYWMPIDLYNGGMEHTTLHLLYSRFWNKFLFDLDVVPFSEPYARRVSHGMILASDGEKMSKSRGNVINPDEVVQEYGADVLRGYEMFIGPYDQAVSWDTNGIKGLKRFQDKVWQFETSDDDADVVSLLQKTVTKITEDIEGMRFNTAISALMIMLNTMQANGASIDTFKTFLQLLAPFMPHIAEEVWERLGEKESIFMSPWPTADVTKITEEKLELPVQVNGKVRDKIIVSPDVDEVMLKQLVLASEKVQKHLEGKEIKKFIYVSKRMVSIVV